MEKFLTFRIDGNSDNSNSCSRISSGRKSGRRPIDKTATFNYQSYISHVKAILRTCKEKTPLVNHDIDYDCKKMCHKEISPRRGWRWLKSTNIIPGLCMII